MIWFTESEALGRPRRLAVYETVCLNPISEVYCLKRGLFENNTKAAGILKSKKIKRIDYFLLTYNRSRLRLREKNNFINLTIRNQLHEWFGVRILQVIQQPIIERLYSYQSLKHRWYFLVGDLWFCVILPSKRIESYKILGTSSLLTVKPRRQESGWGCLLWPGLCPPTFAWENQKHSFPIVILHKLTFIAHSFHEAFIFSPHVRGKSYAKIKPTFIM